MYLTLGFVADQNAYQGNGGAYSLYGFQYQPGFDNAVRPVLLVTTFAC